MSRSDEASHFVYVVAEKMTEQGTRTFWTRIGTAAVNADGSMTVKLDALPLSGTLQIRANPGGAA